MKMTYAKTVSILLLITVVFIYFACAMPAILGTSSCAGSQVDATDEETCIFTYNLDEVNNTATITGFSDSYADEKNIEIPEEIIDNYIEYSVTSIGKEAFKNEQLASVFIPSQVTTIGTDAFSRRIKTGNDLYDYSWNMPSIIKPGEYHAFIEIINYYGSEVELEIPNSIGGTPIKVIGSGAFSNKEFTSVNISDSVIYIGSAAFYANHLLTSVTIGSGVELIGDSAFAHSALTSVDIPDSVKVVGSSAFRDNNLTYVTIGSGVTSMGSNAFSDVYNPLLEIINAYPLVAPTLGSFMFEDTVTTVNIVTGATGYDSGDWASVAGTRTEGLSPRS